MTPEELVRISTFLEITGAPSLFHYLQLEEDDVPVDEVQRRVNERRSWAQAQQANPKYRPEALWILRNGGLFQRSLVDEAFEYRELQADASAQAPALHGQERFHNHYAVFGVGPSASSIELEAAHRARYRWARGLRDQDKAEVHYKAIAAAWHVLNDPSRRASYDVLYREEVGMGAEWEEDTGVERRALALLGPPEEETPPPVHVAGPSPFPPKAEVKRLQRRAPGEPKRRMEVVGKWPRRVWARRSRFSIHVRLTLGGTAPLWVTVSTNQDWLQARTARILLEDTGYRLSFELDARALRERRTNARILLEAANGERETLVLEVCRGGISPKRIATAILVLLGALGAGTFLGWVPGELLFGTKVQGVAVLPGLTLQVDPVPEELLVDGIPIPPETRSISSSELPQARAFTVEARRAGFEAAREMISMRRVSSRHLVLSLPLADSMDFVPRRRDRALSDDGQVAQAVTEAIDGAKLALRGCLSPMELKVSELILQLFLHPKGHIQGVTNLEEQGQQDASLLCLRRVLRTLETPQFKADYAVMEYLLLP